MLIVAMFYNGCRRAAPLLLLTVIVSLMSMALLDHATVHGELDQKTMAAGVGPAIDGTLRPPSRCPRRCRGGKVARCVSVVT